MQNFKKIYNELLNYANNIKIIDTHEHLNPYKNYIGEKPDFLCDYFSHYISTDLETVGMSKQDLNKIKDNRIDIIERFEILEPYLECVKNTSYYRSLQISINKIYNINEISINTIKELNKKFKNNVNNKNYKNYIMKDLCNIEISINDFWIENMEEATTDLFIPVWHASDYILPNINNFENKLIIEKSSFGEYCKYFKEYFLKQKNEGLIAIKNGMAYYRSLYFEEVDYNKAKELYTDFIKEYIELKKENNHLKLKFSKQLQDYMMHFLLKIANENYFIIQIHTGMQEGMNNDLENSNPMLLKNLFIKYPNLTFVIFHMGYPYERELMVLAKTHANVYIDLCWAHLISPYATKKALYEMLDVLPYTKILGFGGDSLSIDGVVGHITLAKENICTVLAKKIDNNECDINLAKKILKAILYDNAKKVFKL